jgi:hypothetical protein
MFAKKQNSSCNQKEGQVRLYFDEATATVRIRATNDASIDRVFSATPVIMSKSLKQKIKNNAGNSSRP